VTEGDLIDQVVSRLKGPAPPNEAAVRNSLVLPVLRALGWNTDDWNQVGQELPIEGNLKPDVALCHPGGIPKIFIEVKRTTTYEQGVEQLLEYSYKRGVSIAVLTDGQRWSFFYPAGGGSFADRQFHHLDLLHRETSDIRDYLRRYLEHSRVKDGSAFEAARQDMVAMASQREALEALPRAWDSMLEDGDESVSLALAERVQAQTGTRPSPDAVEEFLRRIATRTASPTSGPYGFDKALRPTRPVPGVQPSGAGATTALWFDAGNGMHKRRTAIAIVRDALLALESCSPGFLEQYERDARHGRTRRWIAQDRSKLYERPDLCEEYAERVGDNWWLGTNYSNGEKNKMLEDMQVVARKRRLLFKFNLAGSA
jgi:hypothetical protein